MPKELDNLDAAQGVNIEFIDSLKNNGIKYLLIFDDSCEVVCISKAVLDNAISGKPRGLSTTYMKDNFFHQSELGPDVELQNTYIVLFKSPRDVMQVSSFSAQLGLGSELVDWYRDATSVIYVQLFIDLSPRIGKRLHYCTITGIIPSKIDKPNRLKQSKFFEDEHANFLYSPSFPILFPQMQKSFPSVLSKIV